jgi:hypothetical protein
MINGIHLNYAELRTISAKAGRKAILQVLKSTNGNVSETARLLNATRRTIYKALKKEKTGDLDDLSTAPKTIHNKTSRGIEDKVIEIKKKTRFVKSPFFEDNIL